MVLLLGSGPEGEDVRQLCRTPPSTDETGGRKKERWLM